MRRIMISDRSKKTTMAWVDEHDDEKSRQRMDTIVEQGVLHYYVGWESETQRVDPS